MGLFFVSLLKAWNILSFIFPNENILASKKKVIQQREKLYKQKFT